MIDNFETIANYIKNNETTEDNFYFCQIIRRNKDNNAGNLTVRDFYIKNSEDLLNKKADIISFCKMFGARAYINVNVKSYEKCTLEVLKRLAEVISNKQFKATRGLFSSAAGLVSTRDTKFDKVWLIDYDNGDNLEQIERYLAYNQIQFTQIETKKWISLFSKTF